LTPALSLLPGRNRQKSTVKLEFIPFIQRAQHCPEVTVLALRHCPEVTVLALQHCPEVTVLKSKRRWKGRGERQGLDDALPL